MRAIQVVSLDGPRAVVESRIDEPVPGPDHVLIDVHAAGVTFPEVLQSRGEYQLKPPLPFVPGSEVAGVVRSAPPGSGLTSGDRVVALTMFGGYAEVALAPTNLTFPIPDEVDFAAAVALPVNYLTAHFALVRRGGLRAGETVLVHGAAGGVGTASIQVARAFGATVVAVVSTQEKAAVATAAGAHHVVLADGFRAAVMDLTAVKERGGVDVVVDPVGGDRFTDSIRCLCREGRLLVIGFTGGEIPTVRVNRLLLNNVSVVGVAWGEFLLANPAYAREQWDALKPQLAAGALDAPIGHRLPLGDAAEALAVLDERRALGKVVLTVR